MPQTREPNASIAHPGAGCLQWAYREPRRCDLGPWWMVPWRGRAKPRRVGWLANLEFVFVLFARWWRQFHVAIHRFHVAIRRFHVCNFVSIFSICLHVYMLYVHIYACTLIRMGLSFCKNSSKNCFFCPSVHVDVKSDYQNYMFARLHVLRVHIISPNRKIICARITCKHVDI